MNIERNQTNGCDKMSRIYEEMFNVLQDVMQDEQKMKELSPFDFSALGMYIGKFVEQEINSSVVQIMRAFRDVPMPDYYCKRYPGLVKYVDSPYKKENNILVPANYDDYGFLPKPFDDYKRKSVIAIQDGKSVLVSLDGSGRELTKETYDDIRLATKSKKDSPYVYRKKGRVLWGFMDESGQELCDNIIDNYIAGDNCLWYESGDLRGFWNYGKGYPFLPPIYDSIEVIGKTAEPLFFTLKGVDGYVKTDGTFIPMTELESMPEDLHQNNLKDFISE